MESIPYDKRSGKIWFNGKTVNWKDANIHILNHGLHYASCVLEGERVYPTTLLCLQGNVFRSKRSIVKKIFWPCPFESIKSY